MAVNYRNTAVSVGSTSTEISASREKRLVLLVTNDSDEAMYLALGSAAVSGSGIPLGVGSVFVLDNKDFINVPVNAICASGGKSAAITEIYLDSI